MNLACEACFFRIGNSRNDGVLSWTARRMPFGLENVGQDKTERRVRPDFVLHCVLCFRGTQQGSEMQQAGATPAHPESPDSTKPLSKRTWNSSVWLKRAPRSLEHRTLGIRLRELVCNLPPTALGVTAGGATIQHTSRPGEVFNTNLNTCPHHRGQNHGSLLKKLFETHAKLYTKCNLIFKTHDRETTDRRSDCLRTSPRGGSLLALGRVMEKGTFP